MIGVKHFSSKLVPLTTATLLILGMGMLVAGVGSGAETDSVYAESASTQLSVEVPLVLSIMSNTSVVTVNTENLNTFYTGTASVTATTNNPTGYTLTMANNDTDTDLVNGDYDSSVAGSYEGVIESITSEITVDGTGSNFTVNKWGYAKDSAPTVFKPIPLSTSAEEIKQTTGPVDSSSTSVTFGTKVNGDLVSGTYSDTVVFSLTANAVPMSDITKLTSMQQLAEHPEACTNSPVGTIKTNLPDERDDQTYTIAKLADGNCWMTENLRFGALPETTPTDTPTGRPWNSTTDPSLTNTTSAGASKMADLTYDSTNPATAGRIKVASSGNKTADGASDAFSSSGDNFTEPYIMIYQANKSATYDGQTPYGVLYNYCAATGGTVCDNAAMSTDPQSSICPTGWKLPGMTADATGTDADTSGTTKSYNNLANSYSYANTQAGMQGMLGIDNPKSSPINLVRTGYAYNGSLNYRSSSGRGFYWSSTRYTSTNFAYLLIFYDNSGYYVRQRNYSRYSGISVRCVSESN